ncbi:2-oxo acid dehydrogenase subunit E2 [Brevibacterium sp. LS14]|uniref:Dihydrolipoamide acetyltransferase component of pyruvate dehydrogenase complex n=1 Tax=Brevibacterium casei S18 TaxID=1229781 RepID=K9ALV9_9MICO|nr:dihydrolipoamide acetyltransferase family protein [Brevibacterium casei]EKU48289.1 branched-chain alpha-keto acid dehydrogenase subunit E2 [Brevibacterium casei S18]NJE66289.1 2-oxo acid dehydrogenase subunit E2 [Brevibacterium sp. LS14]QQT70131.1 2-oxo acid dehydrogenase subunit E2 [Brevibacterium casei]
MAFEFPLPDVGEGLTEADIVSWKVSPGDEVTVNQILVEIETAKSLVELPSPQAGTVGALLVEEGQTVEVGTPIIRFGGADDSGAEAAETMSAPHAETQAPASEGAVTTDDEGGATLVGYGAKAASSKRRPRKGAPATGGSGASATGGTAAGSAAEAPAAQSGAGAQSGAEAQPAAEAPTASANEAPTGAKPLAKPPVRKLAKDLGVDLATVTATGSRGEVTRADVLAAADGSAAPAVSGATASASVDTGELEERIPFKGVTKMMAKAMVDSAFTMPHVTEFLDVDVTETMAFVRRLKASKVLGEDVRVSPLLIVAKAVAWAVGRNPRINSALEGDDIVVKKYVNLGIAAATPRGLIVPNIKNAHAMGLTQLAQGIQDLTALARSGKTPPADQTGGTITITNVGVFGVDAGTPIINPGEAAILAFGQVRKKPWVVDDEIVPREITTLSVSADHRVVDGEIISKFLADVGRGLEDPSVLLA